MPRPAPEAGPRVKVLFAGFELDHAGRLHPALLLVHLGAELVQVFIARVPCSYAESNNNVGEEESARGRCVGETISSGFLRIGVGTSVRYTGAS